MKKTLPSHEHILGSKKWWSVWAQEAEKPDSKTRYHSLLFVILIASTSIKSFIFIILQTYWEECQCIPMSGSASPLSSWLGKTIVLHSCCFPSTQRDCISFNHWASLSPLPHLPWEWMAYLVGELIRGKWECKSEHLPFFSSWNEPTNRKHMVSAPSCPTSLFFKSNCLFLF